MSTLFECEYVLDKQKYLSWGKENHARSAQRAFSVFWCIFAALVFLYAVYFKFYVLLFFGIFALYRGLFRWKAITARQYSALAKQRGAIRLYSDCFVTGTWDECKKWMQGKGVNETCSR